MSRVDVLSDQSTKAAKSFIYYLNELIMVFKGKISDGSLEELHSIWIVVKRIEPVDIIRDAYVYFLKFYDDVQNGNDKRMLEFDYSTLIVPDCAESTKQLILNLSENIKNIYRQGDEKLNAKIRNYVKQLTTSCFIFKKCDNLIKQY